MASSVSYTFTPHRSNAQLNRHIVAGVLSVLGLTVQMIGGLVCFVDGLLLLRIPLLILGLALCWISLTGQAVNHQYSSNRQLSLFTLMIMLLVMIFASGYNSSMYLFLGGLTCAATFYINSCVVSQGNSLVTCGDVFKAITISHAIMLAAGFFVAGFPNSLRYTGITYNSNAFGLLAVGMSTPLLAYLNGKLTDWIKYGNQYSCSFGMLLVYFLIAIPPLLLVIISDSRMCIAVSLLPFLHMFFLIIYYSIYTPKGIVSGYYSRLLCVWGLCIIFAIIVMIPISFALGTFLEKMGNLSSHGNNSSELVALTNGRYYTWLDTYENSTAWGGGRDFFKNTTKIAPHSSYITILGQYGYISAIAYIATCLVLIYNSFRSSMDGTGTYKYLPLYCSAAYLLLSSTEGLLLTTPMLLCSGFLFRIRC